MELKLEEYQRKMFDHMVAKPRAAVFGGIGLGKTPTTLAAIDHLFFTGESKGVLIVAPKRVASMTWPTEISKWAVSDYMEVCQLRDLLVKPTKKTREKYLKAKSQWENKTADVYIVNFDNIQSMCTNLFCGEDNLPFDTIIVDEASAFKKPSGKRFRSLRKHLWKFNRRIALTGSPSPNSYMDLFGIYLFLDDGAALDHRISRYRAMHFYNPDGRGFKWVLRPGSKELIEEATSHITITMASEDYLDIPPVTIVEHPITLKPASRKVYNTIEKELLIEIEGSEISAPSAGVLVNKLLQITSGCVYDDVGLDSEIHDEKIQAIKKILEGTQRGTLIACSYKHEVSRILRDVEGSERFHEGNLDRWNRGEIKAWVADYRSISHGLNLQAGGHNTIWVTPTYSNESDKQLNGRLSRKGQSHETVIHRLITKDTIDEAVVEALRVKDEGEKGLMQALKLLREHCN